MAAVITIMEARPPAQAIASTSSADASNSLAVEASAAAVPTGSIINTLA
ncbi:hypothetical protein AU374_01316 [Cupriavidus metallidurans]|nr:hypothetical protein AU374_01316 [Cupriavidus metallidurans]